MVERIKSVLNGFFAVDKKLKIVVIAGIIGIFVLMLTEYIPSSVKQEKEAEDKTSQTRNIVEYEQNAEERLKNVLSKIDGVGKLSVMVTLENSGKKVYTADEENSHSQGENDSSSSNSKQYVLIDGEKGDEPLESESAAPNVRGVIVVCEGADDSVVRKDIISAVSAVFNISTSNISVVKGENQNE